MVPWVILSWRLASSLASLANSFPAGLQGSDSSIKIAVFLPNCRKRSNAVFFVPHHLDHLSYEVVLLGRLAGRFCPPRPAARLCPIWITDFFQSRFLTLQYSPRASRSRFPFSTASSALSPLFTHALPSPALCFVRSSFLDGSTV